MPTNQLKQLIAVMNSVQLGSVPRELSKGCMVSILSLSCTFCAQWHQPKGVYLVECADGGLVGALRTLRTKWRLTILLALNKQADTQGIESKEGYLHGEVSLHGEWH